MDFQRIALILAIAAISYMLLIEWNTFSTQHAEQTAASANFNNPAPSFTEEDAGLPSADSAAVDPGDLPAVSSDLPKPVCRQTGQQATD